MHKIAWIDRSLWVFYWVEAFGNDGIRIAQDFTLLQFVLDDRKPSFLGPPEHPIEGNIPKTRTLSTSNI